MKTIEIKYTDSKGNTTERNITLREDMTAKERELYGASKERKVAPHLVLAFCHKRQSWRFFQKNRIEYI